MGSVKKNLFWDGAAHSPLWCAAFYNIHKIVQLLLAKGADPNYRQLSDPSTPLCAAVYRGNEQIVQTLLDHGADINAGKITPLFTAVRRCDLHMVRFLFESGAAILDDSSSERRRSEEMLAMAASRRREPILRLLVEFGASLDLSYRKPKLAILEATRAGRDHVINTLIRLVTRVFGW